MLPERAAPRALVPVAQPDIDPAFLERLTALRQTLAPTLNDGELELFALVAQSKGLDPFSGQIRAVKRNTNRGAVVSYQVGIDGYRSIAERTEQYRGSDEPEFGPECPCGKPPAGHPEWARVIVHRRLGADDYIHQPARVKWHEMIPAEDFMWKEKPEVMLGKTAEAAALRRAFPWVLGNIYIPEEMARADEEAAAPKQIASARETVAARAAELRGEQDAQGEAVDDPGDDDEPPVAPVAVEPTPDAPGPSTGVLVAPPPALTSAEFGKRVKAAGIATKEVKDAALVLFPGTSAADMTDEQWGALWTALTTS